MSKDVFDRNALIKLRLQNARETLRDAHILFESGSSPRSIINRAYYAMYYAALAMLVTVDRSPSKHSGVMAFFDKEFVKSNIVSKELGRMLHDAFESRQDGDYKDYTNVDRQKATEILESDDKLVSAIEEKLFNQS
jgi:uncharacterized protein (UPF0332 family)